MFDLTGNLRRVNMITAGNTNVILFFACVATVVNPGFQRPSTHSCVSHQRGVNVPGEGGGDLTMSTLVNSSELGEVRFYRHCESSFFVETQQGLWEVPIQNVINGTFNRITCICGQFWWTQRNSAFIAHFKSLISRAFLALLINRQSSNHHAC